MRQKIGTEYWRVYVGTEEFPGQMQVTGFDDFANGFVQLNISSVRRYYVEIGFDATVGRSGGQEREA